METRDRRGRQPMHLAAMRNQVHVLKFLYDSGVDICETDNSGKLPQHVAAQHGGTCVYK